MGKEIPQVQILAPVPYERQLGESAHAYEAFLAYRALGAERSTQKVARELTKSPGLIRRWSARWSWVTRVAAYDRDQRLALGLRDTEARERLVALHLDAAASLLDVALRGMEPRPLLDQQGHIITDEEGQPLYHPPSAREMQGAATAMDKAIHHQRLAAGLPTDITRHDFVLKEQIREANEVNSALLAIVGEHLCDDCRERALAELERVAALHGIGRTS